MTRKTRRLPCQKHESDDRHYYSFSCETPYCSGGETRCRKCRWFVQSCQCGFNLGCSRESLRAMRARERRKIRQVDPLPGGV